MKILKKGKVKFAAWLFICEECGCKFLANESDREYDRDGDYVKCPTCKAFIDWTQGEEQ